MRVLFVAQDIGSMEMGMAFRSYNLANQLEENGHKSRLLTASYSHVRRKNPLVKSNLEIQKIENLDYQFIKTFNFKGSLFKRALNMMYFSLKIYFAAKKIVNEFKPDIIIASSPQPLVIFGAHRMAKLAKIPMIFEVRDIWPLSLTETGKVSPRHPFIRLLQFAEDYAYIKSDVVISLLSNAYEHMKKRGLIKSKFHCLPNGYESQTIISSIDWSIKEKIEAFRKKYSTLVGYAGAHGIMNNLDQLIMVGPKVINKNIGIVLIGDGPEKVRLLKLVENQNIENILFLDPIPKDQIVSFLDFIDIAFIGLQSSPLFKFGISPNKLLDYMGAGKPVLMAIDCQGDPVELSGCGLKARPGDINDISLKLTELHGKTATELKQMGELGRLWINKNLSAARIYQKFEELLKKTIEEKK